MLPVLGLPDSGSALAVSEAEEDPSGRHPEHREARRRPEPWTSRSTGQPRPPQDHRNSDTRRHGPVVHLAPAPAGVAAAPSARDQRTTNDVCSVPAEPPDTTIDQRPGVVRVPTIHVQLMRPPLGRFGYRP